MLLVLYCGLLHGGTIRRRCAFNAFYTTRLTRPHHRMVQAYNFQGSWQLFPEKGSYEHGNRPKSGFYKIEVREDKTLSINVAWVTLEDHAYTFGYRTIADGDTHPADEPDVLQLADNLHVQWVDSVCFVVVFSREGREVLRVTHRIEPNGYLSIEQCGHRDDGSTYLNRELFHRQLSVLPYSSSVSGAVIKANEEGVIRHKALTAMEQQTNMQLNQIRQQIELLALQAQEIQKRKELSMLIYNAKLSFQPVIGQRYYLYERADGSHFLSMIAPKEWGAASERKFKTAIAQVELLADHTWREV
jgi:Protein of unknown function (DUF2452)